MESTAVFGVTTPSQASHGKREQKNTTVTPLHKHAYEISQHDSFSRSKKFPNSSESQDHHPLSGSKRPVLKPQPRCDVVCADMEEKRASNETIQKFVSSYTQE